MPREIEPPGPSSRASRGLLAAFGLAVLLLVVLVVVLAVLATPTRGA